MSGLSDAAQEHGYYERFITVWNPNEGSDERTLSDLTIGIIGDEDSLAEINLLETVEQLNEVPGASEKRSHLQEHLGSNLRAMLRNDLIEYAYCDEHGIDSVDDLESRLDDSDFGVFPL